MKKIDLAWKNLRDVQNEIEERGDRYELYDKTLKFLTSSETVDDFLKRYHEQYVEGYNSIEMDEYIKIKDKKAYLRGEYALNDLKFFSINTVVEYTEAYLEELQDDEEF